MPKPNQVFISHSTKDREFVEREIISLLIDHGIKPWYSSDEIHTASKWERNIQAGLEQSDWFLVVLSRNSVESDWVAAEVHWAMDERRHQFVPLLIEECDWQRLHLMMRTIQHVDFRLDLNEARRRLLKPWEIDYQPVEKSSDAASNQLTVQSPRKPSKAVPITPDRLRSQPQQLKERTLKVKCVCGADLTAEEKNWGQKTECPKCSKLVNVPILNSIGMKLTLIPAGEFLMGSPDSNKIAKESNELQHHIEITTPYYLGVNPVTQTEYEKLMGDNLSKYKGNDLRPVENVTWFDAAAFCNKLSELEKLPLYYEINEEDISFVGGNGYRLPTEAEWEYACRAGTTTKWSFGDDGSQLRRFAWYSRISGGRTQPVGEKKPNPWGLYDMYGNVSQWCWDWYDDGYYKDSPKSNPEGPMSGESRVLRGGAIGFETDQIYSARRGWANPAYRLGYVGFRLARTHD